MASKTVGQFPALPLPIVATDLTPIERAGVLYNTPSPTASFAAAVPVLTQGVAVTFDAASTFYWARVGELVFVVFHLIPNSLGTVSTAVEMTLTGCPPAAGGQPFHAGSALYYVNTSSYATTTAMIRIVVAGPTPSIRFQKDSTGFLGEQVGERIIATPAFNYLSGSMFYRAA